MSSLAFTVVASATEQAASIDYSSLPEVGGLGSLGALVAVLLRWFELRGKLDSTEYLAMRRAPIVWAVFILGILASGILTWVIHHEAGVAAGVAQIFITGAAAPPLMTQLIAARTNNAPMVFGDTPLKSLFK